VSCVICPTACSKSQESEKQEKVRHEGLLAVYSNGARVLEGPINHGWSNKCADHNMYQGECNGASLVNWADGQDFSVVWSGLLYAPSTGEYTIKGWIDGDLAIQINGAQVLQVNSHGDHCSGVVTLEGGAWYPIYMTYKPNGGSNNMILVWIPPGQTSEVIPRKYLGSEDPLEKRPDDGIHVIEELEAS